MVDRAAYLYMIESTMHVHKLCSSAGGYACKHSVLSTCCDKHIKASRFCQLGRLTRSLGAYGCAGEWAPHQRMALLWHCLPCPGCSLPLQCPARMLAPSQVCRQAIDHGRPALLLCCHNLAARRQPCPVPVHTGKHCSSQPMPDR